MVRAGWNVADQQAIQASHMAPFCPQRQLGATRGGRAEVMREGSAAAAAAVRSAAGPC